MKTIKRITALILAVVMTAMIPVIGFAKDSSAEPVESKPAAQTDLLGREIVADLYLLVSNANPRMPHIWLYMVNRTDKTLLVGHYKLPAGESVSMGCWRDRGNGPGIHYNLERYFVKPATYTRTMYLKTTVTASELKSVTRVINSHNYWNYAFNCAWFALSVWNVCTWKIIPYVIEPHVEWMFMLLYGAKKIDFRIEKQNNPRKVYKHTDSGLQVCYSGALWTKTGV